MSPHPHWLETIPALKVLIDGNNDPITFLIGAGASISSGAPTTGTVEEALCAAMGYRRLGHELPKRIHRVTEEEKRNVLLPILANLRPGSGYRQMAQLARQRQIRVLNLNWDDLVEQACKSVNVSCASYNLATSSSDEILKALSSKSKELICLHLHGRIKHEEDPIQFGLLETLAFADANERLVSDFFRCTTVIVGTSLNASASADTDMLRMLRNAAQADQQLRRRHPVFLFTRETKHDALSPLLLARTSEDNVVSDPQIDFDRLMFELCKLRRSSAEPSGRRLISPKAELYRAALDARVVGILGERFVGKSVLAHYIADLHASWSSRPSSVERLSCPRGSGEALGRFQKLVCS